MEVANGSQFCKEIIAIISMPFCHIFLQFPDVNVISYHLKEVHKTELFQYFENFVLKNDLDDVGNSSHFEEEFDCYRYLRF